MADVLLKGGACDPRRVEMTVTTDAAEVFVRPTPFECHDVYAVSEKILDADGTVSEATGEYRHTTGPRSQVELYRRKMAAFRTGRAFVVKRST